MRELKFRAWDKKTKKLREVDSIAFHNERGYADWNGSLTPKVANLWGFDPIEDKHVIRSREAKDIDLMQFTGLTDKNGKGVYEGDICQYRDDAHIARIGVVRYSETACVYNIECVDGDEEGNQDIQCHADYTIAVIGNIYEHPELAQRGDDAG